MKTIQRRIEAENGELYCTIGGSRTLMARCRPEFDIIEQSDTLRLMGGCRVRSMYLTIILCDDMEETRDIDIKLLNTVSGFDLSADIQHSDGIYEKVILRNIVPTDIDLYGSWEFELNDPETARKLLGV